MVRRCVIQQNMNLSAVNCGPTENVNHMALDCDFFGTLWFLLRQWMYCEFGQNHTNEKYKDVWSKGSDNQWIKSLKQQQQSTALKPSVEQHHKHNQAIRISNERKGTNTPSFVDLVRSNMT